MANQSPDWEDIERLYRAGSLSVVSIAKDHGITEGAIRKRAKKEGWSRDLTQKVKLATRDKIARTEVRDLGTNRTDSEIIDQASDEAASIVLSHRKDIAQSRALTRKLMDALTGMSVDSSNHNDFARSLNACVDAQGKVIKLERQAYNIDDQPQRGDVDTLSDLMDTLTDEA